MIYDAGTNASRQQWRGVTIELGTTKVCVFKAGKSPAGEYRMDACKRDIPDARVVRSLRFSNANRGFDGPELR
jgi:hypothetical protein